jgi:hypothetical protein
MDSPRLRSFSPLSAHVFVIAIVAAGCLPFGDYQPAGAGPSVGGNGGDGGDGGAASGGGEVGGDGGGSVCNPLDEDNPNCADCVKNGLETDVDCGGDSCGPCLLEAICATDADCESGNCDALVCVVGPSGPLCEQDPDGNATCADCVQNGGETDVDCGGDACGPCVEGAFCQADTDCHTGNCAAGTCGRNISGCETVDDENPSCGDCETNGSETDEDCGGDACPPCQVGKDCSIDADCISENCDGGMCGAPATPECPEVDPENPTCADCVVNGLETDVDCGGDACGPCDIGDDCDSDADCASEDSTGGTCS